VTCGRRTELGDDLLLAKALYVLGIFYFSPAG